MPNWGGGIRLHPPQRPQRQRKKYIRWFNPDLINVTFSDKNAPTREALMMEVVLKDTEFAAHVSTK